MSDEVTTVYISNVTSSMELRKQQSKILDVLSSCKIKHTVVDVSEDKERLVKMRDIVGDPHAVPPQIAKGGVYCGNFDAFDDAVECKTLNEFLKL